jgi:hypothetical protein
MKNDEIEKKTKIVKAWAVIGHGVDSTDNPKFYFQNIKPKVTLDCGCPAKIVRCEIIYHLP